jgi:hypothetical protein
LNKICDAFEHGSNERRLGFLVENLDDCQKVWQLRSQQRKLQIIDSKPATSLESLIRTQSRLSLRDKRRLALIFAYSLLKYHDSEWLSDEWGKSSISFFYSSQEKPDLMRPYLSTRFDKSQSASSQMNMMKFHPNSSILALGILLIEMDLGKPIEAYRTATEDINVNTDMIVADRTVKSMDQCSDPYRGAIVACLKIPWVPAGQKVSLEDMETRNGLCINVVHPLERELEYLFPK